MKGISGAQSDISRTHIKMTHLSFRVSEEEDIDNDIIEEQELIELDNVYIKVETNQEGVVKMYYTMNRAKKMKELKDNLKRENIHEIEVKEDIITFKIEPGCYSEISKKFKESVIGDEITDESVGTDSPVGVKMKLEETKGMEEQAGAKVNTQLSWKVTDLRSKEVMTVKLHLYHTRQTMMLQGGKRLGEDDNSATLCKASPSYHEQSY